MTDLTDTAQTPEASGKPRRSYDSLTVAEILPHLPKLSADALGRLRSHELKHKNRKSVIQAVDALLAALQSASHGNAHELTGPEERKSVDAGRRTSTQRARASAPSTRTRRRDDGGTKAGARLAAADASRDSSAGTDSQMSLMNGKKSAEVGGDPTQEVTTAAGSSERLDVGARNGAGGVHPQRRTRPATRSTVECDACGTHVKASPFCPNCGAALAGEPSPVATPTAPTAQEVQEGRPETPKGACPYCHTAVSSDGLPCTSCGTEHHRDCWWENGGCSVPGCAGASIDTSTVASQPGVAGSQFPASPVAAAPPPPPPAANQSTNGDLLPWASEPASGKGRRNALVVIAVLVVAGVAIAGVASRAASHATHTVKGTFELHDSSPYSDNYWTSGGSCEGSGGYSDIQEGATVNVLNQDGTVIATGALGSGTAVTRSECDFPINVDNVPDATFYKIEVTHRGQLTFSKSEMESNDWTVHPTLGS